MRKIKQFLTIYQYNLNWLKSKPIAHRGLHNNADRPENSFAAFNAAIEKGLPFELDLQFTKDEKIVVFHDENLERMTNIKKTIAEINFSELRGYRLKGSNESIPLLSELLEHVNERVSLLIELKNFARPNNFEMKVIEQLKSYKGEFALQSFNPLTVRWLKLNAPEIIRGQISSRFRGLPVPLHYKYMLRNLTLNFSAKPHFINYNIDDLPYLPVELYRNHGIPILAWTVKTKAQLSKANELADNFVFEDLDPSELVR